MIWCFNLIIAPEESERYVAINLKEIAAIVVEEELAHIILKNRVATFQITKDEVFDEGYEEWLQNAI